LRSNGDASCAPVGERVGGNASCATVTLKIWAVEPPMLPPY
jgi:hypothetical protein